LGKPDDEIWKDIPGYEGAYQASDKGRIRSLDRISTDCNGVKTRLKGKILRAGKNRYGYLKVSLSCCGSRKTKTVHRLVALAFLGPSDLTVNHINGVKHLNHLTNLEYMTYKENIKHACDNGLIELVPIICKENNKTYESMKEASIDLNINPGNISLAAAGKKDFVDGMTFDFVCEKKREKAQILRTERKKKKGSLKKVICNETGQVFKHMIAVARAFDISKTTVRRSITGKSKSLRCGYSFSYAD